MKNSLLVLVVVALVAACAPSVPPQYIQPDDMEDILYDYHVAQAMVKIDRQSESQDFDKSLYFQTVLKKHGITEAEFDSSMIYYYSHLVRLKKIYTEVNERLADEAKQLGASVGEIGRYSQYSTTGDTANVWTGATDVLLMPQPTMNRFDFTVKVDTSFYKGDSFMFQFMSEYIWQSGMKDAVVCIVTKYEGDSIIQTSNHVSVSGLLQIRIPANNEKKLKSMSGFVYLAPNGDADADNPRRLMFISQIQLIRFHNKEQKNESQAEPQKADSLQRGADPRRPLPDSARAGDQRGLPGRPVPVAPGAGPHGVADRSR